MRKEILDRYARTSDNKLLIEIDAGKVEDLYNAFDRNAPYVRKELDEDLVEYLIDSVSEIGNEEFVIQFRFASEADSALAERLMQSIQNYFLYLKELEYRELASMARTSFLLLVVGVVILTLSVWMSQKIGTTETLVSRIAAEGLTVAAWVALWNGIATFIVNWAPHRRQIKRYERISKATILFS